MEPEVDATNIEYSSTDLRKRGNNGTGSESDATELEIDDMVLRTEATVLGFVGTNLGCV
jgi:hypothetical protein